ncbi:hypothetical protein TrVGV298_011378 [Trichoderma virens]|nr:hypothetical protein TrVGV298_011378 [Trichoderma virens]
MIQYPGFTSFAIRDRTNRCNERFEECFTHPKLSAQQWLVTGRADFNGWSLGLNASHSGRSSLDHKVCQRPDLIKLITLLLDGLDGFLKECLHQDEPQGTPSPEEDEENPLYYTILDIKSILKQLTILHAAIRASGTQLRHHKADISLKSVLEDNSNGLQEFGKDMTEAILAGLESWNRGDGLPKPWGSANNNLIERFVNANVKRRNRINFATEEIRKKIPLQLKKNQEPVVAVDLEKAVTKIAIVSRLNAGEETEEPERKQGGMSKTGESAKDPLLRRERLCEGSQIPTAATAIPLDVVIDQAPSSVAGTNGTEATGSVLGQSYMYPLPPKWPKESTVPIECPYCSELLTKEYMKQAAWNGHVSGDILPYMCFIEDCKTPDDLYRTSEELTEHVISVHGVPCWICDECTPDTEQNQFEIFETAELWRDHCSHEHSETIPDSIFSKFAESKMRKMVPPIKCPLCDYATSEIKANIDPEILRHIHQFSLRSLPWEARAEGNLSEEHLEDWSSSASNATTCFEGLPTPVHQAMQLTDHEQMQLFILETFEQLHEAHDSLAKAIAMKSKNN